MASIRYFVALFLVVSLPPLFLYWLLIHPSSVSGAAVVSV
jgi:hypothetical protein